MTPDSSSLPPLPHPSLKGKLKIERAAEGRKNPEENAALGGKEGGAAGKWPRPARGLRRRKYHFLACLLWGLLRPASGYSSALRDTASPWKAEVVLPLQRASLRQASPFPSPLWGLTFTGRVGAPRRTNTNMTSLLQWEVEWTHTHLPGLTVPAPKGRPKDRRRPLHQMFYRQRQEGGDWKEASNQYGLVSIKRSERDFRCSQKGVGRQAICNFVWSMDCRKETRPTKKLFELWRLLPSVLQPKSRASTIKKQPLKWFFKCIPIHAVL